MKQVILTLAIALLGITFSTNSNTLQAQNPHTKVGEAEVEFEEGWYRLQTVFRGENESLEGNDPKSPVKGGAAFMDRKQNVSGQLWKLEPVDAHHGYYRLKTMFRGEGECLEGNDPKSPVKGGAAFMDKCQNVSGQLWKITKTQ